MEIVNGWAVDYGTYGAKQVYPVGDLREHWLTRACWCGSTYDEEDDIIIHNSMDKREQYETGERNPS